MLWIGLVNLIAAGVGLVAMLARPPRVPVLVALAIGLAAVVLLGTLLLATGAALHALQQGTELLPSVVGGALLSLLYTFGIALFCLPGLLAGAGLGVLVRRYCARCATASGPPPYEP